MNYCEIGKRIRKYRKAKGLSQEQLAEKVDISVTHMSHIETGNTKLSLPVFVRLAKALDIQTDDMLSDEVSGKARAMDDLFDILQSCTAEEARIITDIVRSTKAAFDKYKDQ